MAYFFYLTEYYTKDKTDHLKTWNRLKTKIIKRFGMPDDPRDELKVWSISITTHILAYQKGYILPEKRMLYYSSLYSVKPFSDQEDSVNKRI